MELINIIKQSVDVTYNKYYLGTDRTVDNFTENAIKEVIQNENYTLFTSSNNARSNIRAIGKNALIVELIKGAYLTYTIETTRGYAREQAIMGNHGYPETKEQAVDFIFNRLIKQDDPINIYNELLDIRSTNLVNLLVSNYSYLINDYTQQEIMECAHVYVPYLQENLNKIDELQNSLLVNPNQFVNENTTLLGY